MMRTELLAELRRVMRGEHLAKSDVTPATPVTLQFGYGSKAPELQALQRLQVQSGKVEKDDRSPVTLPPTARAEAEEAAIEERAGLADSVPAVYRDAWARLNVQKPWGVSEEKWRLALDDGGLFLDEFGSEAAFLGWTADEIFDLWIGILWQLKGERVQALGPDDADLSSGRIIRRVRVRR
jgi:hypothetical protein